MATGTIKRTWESGALTSAQGSGTSGKYFRIGNLVVVDVTINKINNSWTIVTGLPPITDTVDAVIGYVGVGNTPQYAIYITNTGTIQLKAGILTDTYHFSGCYIAP